MKTGWPMDNSEDFDEFPDIDELIEKSSARLVALNREKKRGVTPKTKKKPLENES